jgi:hypothetical protein
MRAPRGADALPRARRPRWLAARLVLLSVEPPSPARPCSEARSSARAAPRSLPIAASMRRWARSTWGIPTTCDRNDDADGDGLFDVYETESRHGHGRHPEFPGRRLRRRRLPRHRRGGAVSRAARRATPTATPSPTTIDNDSDNDGLSDGEERDRYFTNPLAADSDGDTFDDLAEAVNDEANPLDPLVGIDPEDFYIVLPYMDPAVDRELQFNSRVRQADVFFMMDRTGSMSEEVNELKDSLETVVAGITDAIPDIGVGFGGFAGFGGRAAGGCTSVLGIETCQGRPRRRHAVPPLLHHHDRSCADALGRAAARRRSGRRELGVVERGPLPGCDRRWRLAVGAAPDLHGESPTRSAGATAIRASAPDRSRSWS